MIFLGHCTHLFGFLKFVYDVRMINKACIPNRTFLEDFRTLKDMILSDSLTFYAFERSGDFFERIFFSRLGKFRNSDDNVS